MTRTYDQCVLPVRDFYHRNFLTGFRGAPKTCKDIESEHGITNSVPQGVLSVCSCALTGFRGAPKTCKEFSVIEIPYRF